MRRALRLIGLVAIIACSANFAPASLVTNLRVIGAGVEVEGEATRANPSPGERVQVSVLAADLGALPALTWSFVACVPTPTRIGPQICGAPIVPCDGCTGPPPTDDLALPVIGFQVPPKEELDAVEARDVLLQGVVCGNGVPSPSAIQRFISGESEDLEPCEGPEIIPGIPIQGRFVTIQIPIERDPEDPNLNPEISTVTFAGRAWPKPYNEGVPRTAPRTGCEGDLDLLTDAERDAHPRAGSAPSNIELFVPRNSLQSYTVDGVDLTEEIQVSWLGDGGAFEVSFSFITDPAVSILTQWKPPPAPLPSAYQNGQLVRFNFVIRDGRGGLDRVERGLCVLP